MTKKNIDERRDLTYHKIRVAIIKKMIHFCNPENKTIVDLACGESPITDNIQFKKRYLIDIIHGYDLEKKIPLKNNIVDIVIAGEIIEHLKNVELFISEIKRILRGGGFDYIVSQCV